MSAAGTADWPWSVLGLGATGDAVAIKRAYAVLLKRTRPDDDPAGYQALRAAYDAALAQAGARQMPGAIQPPQPAQPPAQPAGGGQTQEAHGAQEGIGTEQAAAVRAEQVLAAFLAHPPMGNQRPADWEGLRAALDALPLQRRADASIACAETILGNFHLSSRIALELDRYFQWSSDFRLSERLGQTRLRDLRTWMREHEVRLRNAASLDRMLADDDAREQAPRPQAAARPQPRSAPAPAPAPAPASWWQRLTGKR